MKLFLYRHGETVFNRENRLQGGNVDSRLTEKGLRQAKANAEYLKGREIQAIFTSSQKRAQKTASFLRKKYPKIPYFELKVLREIENGEVDGMLIEKAKKKYPMLRKRLEFKDMEKALPGGESYKDVRERLRPFLKRLEKNYSKKTVAVVAHGGTGRILIGLIFGLPNGKLSRITCPNDTIFEIDCFKEKPAIYNISKGKRKKGFVYWKRH